MTRSTGYYCDIDAWVRRYQEKEKAMNSTDANDLLGQVREALGADPKEGVVAAARRVVDRCARLQTANEGLGKANDAKSARATTAEAAQSSANQVILQQLDEVKELRGKLQTVASALGFAGFGEGADIMGALFEMRGRANKAKAAEEVLAEEIGKRVEAEKKSEASGHAGWLALEDAEKIRFAFGTPFEPTIAIVNRIVREREEWKARAEKAEARHGNDAGCRIVEEKLAEEKRKREEAEKSHAKSYGDWQRQSALLQEVTTLAQELNWKLGGL